MDQSIGRVPNPDTGRAGKTVEEITDQTYVRYKTIFENTGTATVVIEDDMTISMVNSELERISGIAKDAVEGKMKFPDLIAEPDRAKVMDNHCRRREDPHGVPRNYPCRVIVPNGGVKECILTVALIRGTRQSVASITDISRQKQLEREIARVSEDEQQRMGQILHDDLGSHLAGVEAMASLLAVRLKKEGHKDAGQAQEIRALVNEAIEKTRAMVRGLLPVRLSDTGFMAAVRQLARDTERAFGIDCRVTDRAGKAVWPDAVATHLYYIIRESVHNAVRHGNAGRIEIIFFEEDRQLVMEICDNGTGMPGSDIAGADIAGTGITGGSGSGLSVFDTSGMGLTIMQHRADLIGAGLAIVKNDSGGMTVRCSIGKKYLS